MTLDQLLTSLVTLLTRSGSNRVSANDILTACQSIVNFFASQIASIIPDWSSGLTFNTDGSGAGKYCKYPDSTGKKRLYETKTSSNTNHTPPAEGGENTYWKEISASASAVVPEWSAGVYGPGIVIVYHNHSTDGRGLYVLIDPVRPFNSTNIETEITASKWERLGGTDTGGGTWGTITGTITTQADLVAYIAAQIAALVDASPSTLDTLNELAAALGDDPNFATTVAAAIGAKVSKAGDTMSGNLAMSGNKVTGLAAASGNGEAVRYEQLVAYAGMTDVASNAIQFDSPKRFRTPGAPGSGAVTLNTSGLVAGMMCILYHNDASEPSWPAEFVKLGGAYVTSSLNVIMMMAYSSSRIEYTISQQV